MFWKETILRCELCSADNYIGGIKPYVGKIKYGYGCNNNGILIE